MAQFQYTAVNNSGKKLNGVIGASTEEDARKQLSTFGISLLAIQKMLESSQTTVTNEPGTSQELARFEFEAYDKSGKKILGTIPASNRYKAFKRLMDEYHFEVSFVVPAGSSPEEKLKAKQEDLSILKAEYDSQLQKKDSGQKEEEKISAEFEEKRKILLFKVDFILNKIRSLLSEFVDELSPDSKKIIQSYIDKLLRIKSSTNLDYIESTSEELLKKVQDQELFLHKERMGQAKDHLRLEAQKLMADLHSKPGQSLDLIGNVDSLQSKFSTSANPLLQGFSMWLKRFLPTPEEKAIREKISTVSGQIWTYRKIVWSAPASAKEEAKASLEALKTEKKRLEQELKALNQNLKHGEDTPSQEEPLVTEEVNSFLGWLLGFYMVAYFLSYYSVSKILPWDSLLPANFNLLSSPLLRHILISLFFWYVLLSLRIEYLRYTRFATLWILPPGIVISAILVFNL